MIEAAKPSSGLYQAIRRFLTHPSLLLAVLVYVAGNTVNAAGSADQNTWVATWGASPFAFVTFGNTTPPGPFSNQTVRQKVRISVGGEQLRVRFSNEIGDTPLTIGSASIAIADKES